MSKGGVPKRKPGDERTQRSLERLRLLLDDHDIDDRLTPGQMHALAVDALGEEPISFVCNILALAMDARSKISVAPAEAARLALGVMDRLYGPPDVKMRKKAHDETQFELEFAWATPEGGETKVTAEGQSA